MRAAHLTVAAQNLRLGDWLDGLTIESIDRKPRTIVVMVETGAQRSFEPFQRVSITRDYR